MNNEKYKKGDVLICLPGFDTSDDSAGSGYVENRIFTVFEVHSRNSEYDKYVYWPKEKTPNGNGIYGKALDYFEESMRTIPIGSKVRVLDTANVRDYSKHAIGHEFITTPECYAGDILLCPTNQYGVNYRPEDLLIIKSKEGTTQPVINNYQIY